MTQQYVGTKQVTAWEQEKDLQPGYAVKYEDGYISWSPKAVFEAAYLSLGHIGHLPAHAQRVVAERAQLADKLAKLNKFLGGDHSAQLLAVDRELLQLQAHQMGQYLRTLDLRLERMQ